MTDKQFDQLLTLLQEQHAAVLAAIGGPEPLRHVPISPPGLGHNHTVMAKCVEAIYNQGGSFELASVLYQLIPLDTLGKARADLQREIERAMQVLIESEEVVRISIRGDEYVSKRTFQQWIATGWLPKRAIAFGEGADAAKQVLQELPEMFNRKELWERFEAKVSAKVASGKITEITRYLLDVKLIEKLPHSNGQIIRFRKRMKCKPCATTAVTHNVTNHSGETNGR